MPTIHEQGKTYFQKLPEFQLLISSQVLLEQS